MSKLSWYKFTEHNDNEGETWHFFLLLTEQEEEWIEQLIEDSEDEDSYYIDMETFEETEIDILVKHTDSGYIDTYNKIGRPKLNILEIKDVNDFYKGRFWLK